MKVIDFDSDLHYGFAASWWAKHEKHGWQPLPQAALPETGLIVYDGTKPVCCGFLYQTDSAIVIMDHIISDPSVHKLIRSRSLDLLIKELLNKTDQGDIVMSFLQHDGLIKRHLKHGFKKGDENMTILISPGGGEAWQRLAQ